MRARACNDGGAARHYISGFTSCSVKLTLLQGRSRTFTRENTNSLSRRLLVIGRKGSFRNTQVSFRTAWQPRSMQLNACRTASRARVTCFSRFDALKKLQVYKLSAINERSVHGYRPSDRGNEPYHQAGKNS